jgi:hypothetical protein
MTTFLGIYREPSCSPGRHRANDAAILELVAEGLEASGHAVALATMEEAGRHSHDAAMVFSMSRSPAGLQTLTRWAREGKTIVNTPAAVLDTSRDRLARRIFSGAICLPATRVVPTARARRGELHLEPHADGCWIKGGDLYASTREDVRRVETIGDVEDALDDFERRGISTAVLQEHVPGREIKFYAVGSGDFFHWLDVGDVNAHQPPPASLHPVAAGAGVDLNLEIFGGDLVVGEDGRITLIDLNDWPTFAPCREPAAAAIARYLEARLTAGYAATSLAASGRGSSPE